MQKIPTIFKRNYSKTYQVLPIINPECQWVFDGHGIPYRKFQGMAAMIKQGTYYKRTIIKKNQPIPETFILTTTDLRAQKHFGWLPVDPYDPQDQYYLHAYDPCLPDGTYELLGPKILDNPEHMSSHILLNHKHQEITLPKRSYASIKHYLSKMDFEGIVFHHHLYGMAKIKKKDFGFVR